MRSSESARMRVVVARIGCILTWKSEAICAKRRITGRNSNNVETITNVWMTIETAATTMNTSTQTGMCTPDN